MISRCFCFPVVALGLLSLPASAVTVTTAATEDVTFEDPDGDGVFNINTNDAILSNRSFPLSPGSPNDTSVAFFDLGAVGGQAVTSATLFVDVFSFTSGTDDIDIGGYVDNGAITPFDRIAPTVTLGTFDPNDGGLGLTAISLDPTALNGLLAVGSSLGIRFNPTGNANTQFSSIDNTFGGVGPTLTVVAIPEPASATALVATTGCLVLARRRKRRLARSPQFLIRAEDGCRRCRHV